DRAGRRARAGACPQGRRTRSEQCTPGLSNAPRALEAGRLRLEDALDERVALGLERRAQLGVVLLELAFRAPLEQHRPPLPVLVVQGWEELDEGGELVDAIVELAAHTDLEVVGHRARVRAPPVGEVAVGEVGRELRAGDGALRRPVLVRVV